VSTLDFEEPNLLSKSEYLAKRFYGFSYIPQSYLPSTRFTADEQLDTDDTAEGVYRKAIKASARLKLLKPDFDSTFFSTPENRIILFEQHDFEIACFFIGAVLFRSSLRSAIVGNHVRDLFASTEIPNWSPLLWHESEVESTLPYVTLENEATRLRKPPSKGLVCGAGFELIFSKTLPQTLRDRLLLRCRADWIRTGYVVEGGANPRVGRILNCVFSVWRPTCGESLFA
jgi:hypothetical protein